MAVENTEVKQNLFMAIITWPLRVMRKMYDWVLSFADSPNSERSLFLLSFAESSFFPVPPDVLLMPLVLGKPNKWLRFALFCSIASVIGGVFGFGIGYFVWQGVADTVLNLHIPGINAHNFEKAAAWFSEYNFWIVFAAGFTPLPYKVITISAGLFAVSPEISVGQFFVVFLVASTISRSARFFLVAGVCRVWGPKALPFIDKYFGWLALAFFLMLFGGFYVLKLM